MLCTLLTWFRHFRAPGGTVRGQPPSLCILLKFAAQAQHTSDWQLQLCRSSCEIDFTERLLHHGIRYTYSMLPAISENKHYSGAIEKLPHIVHSEMDK